MPPSCHKGPWTRRGGGLPSKTLLFALVPYRGLLDTDRQTDSGQPIDALVQSFVFSLSGFIPFCYAVAINVLLSP